MAKYTKTQLEQMVEEALCIKSVADRFSALEKDIKKAMVTLSVEEVDNPRYGRVFISKSERVTVSPELARSVLGELAEKLIQVKESVPNERLKVLIDMGDVSEDQREQIEAGAARVPVVNLYIRPLQ